MNEDKGRMKQERNGEIMRSEEEDERINKIYFYNELKKIIYK